MPYAVFITKQKKFFFAMKYSLVFLEHVGVVSLKSIKNMGMAG